MDEKRKQQLEQHIATLEKARKPGKWRFALTNGVFWGIFVALILIIFDVFVEKKQEFISMQSLVTLLLFLAFGVVGYGLTMYWFYGRLITKYKKEIADYEQR